MDKFGGRKFIGFVVVIMLGYSLVLIKDLKTAIDFMTFAFGVFTVYVGGNLINKKVTEETK